MTQTLEEVIGNARNQHGRLTLEGQDLDASVHIAKAIREHLLSDDAVERAARAQCDVLGIPADDGSKEPEGDWIFNWQVEAHGVRAAIKAALGEKS